MAKVDFKMVTVPILEANELSYEYNGRWDARYSKYGRLLINDGVSILGMNMNDGQDIRTLGNGYHVLLGHVPLTVLNQPFVPPAFALVPVPSSVHINPFWLTTGIPTMRLQTCTPAVTPRGRPRQTMKTPYSRVNSIKKLHPGLQEIIKNCPALDIIFDHDNPRGSTHSRSRGRDKEHVARPPNAFMVYRSYVWYTKQLENKDEKNLSCVSRLAGRSWRVLSEQARTPFKQVAAIAKREHAERNPDYKYSPSSRSPKSQRKPARAGSRAKGKAKAKQTATLLNGGIEASPPPKEVTPVPSVASFADVLPASSESSPSPSSPSPSTPTALSPRRLTRMSPSPQLEYPSDCDIPDSPPRPRFRPTMLGLIPSPSMSILELNEDEQPSILDQFPEKYEEAESYHNLQPHALLFNEEFPFDGADHNMRISLFARTESIDYSSFISGNPEVKFGSPPSPACVLDLPSSIFSPGPSTSTVIDDGFNSPLSSTLDWSVFDMPTLGSDRALDDSSVFGPNDGEIFDALVTCGGY